MFWANENTMKCLLSHYATLITKLRRHLIPGVYCEELSNECAAENFQLKPEQDRLQMLY